MSFLITEDPITENDVETREDEEDLDLKIKFESEDTIQTENSTSDSTKLTIPVDSEAAGEEIKITKVNGSDCNKERKNAKENSIWVSNLNCNIKAVDVREVFSKIGKVKGVKILTNNSNYFAYVTMKDAEQVALCIEKLNNTAINGENIILSTTKPCIKEAETKVKTKEDNTDVLKQENNVTARTSNNENNVKSVSEVSNTDGNSSSIIAKQKREISRLKHELKIVNNKNSSLKPSLKDIQKKYDTVYSKYKNLKNQMEKMETENRQRRRKLILDQENFEHSIKSKMVAVDNLKQELNRQLEVTKQLKERLNNKLSDLNNYNTYKRTRSPSRSRRSRGQQGKKFRHLDDFDKTKTPPPPNLRIESGKQSGYNASSSSHAPAFSSGMKPAMGFNRHENRPFQQSIHHHSNLDQRRANTHEYGAFSASQPFSMGQPVRGPEEDLRIRLNKKNVNGKHQQR
ncbi:unnamed protein product [Diabrotica balteata]|uniref:RRM domain-containing protein n=1 Tax=Diabrotica balteata TaxID=107213 RepID=A0A9P0GXI5_DIABA|nr:unnamed protein product [Diabrotica balteata]